jgi:hypothetical protein
MRQDAFRTVQHPCYKHQLDVYSEGSAAMQPRGTAGSLPPIRGWQQAASEQHSQPRGAAAQQPSPMRSDGGCDAGH